ncbi:MAG: tripartite tricarboxylate transporter substrate binding protein [Oscillospiraceae bacterium]|nr:tripartite tricarboxylate transporter substrate binding protein [Oscillospiraceae bacterium]
MKKLLAILLAAVLVFGLVACTTTPAATPTPAPATPAPGPAETPTEPAAPGADFHGGQPITLVVPWAAGGGTDLGARIILPYLESYLGTNIVVQNLTGGSGWIGWEHMLTAPADGMTFAMINTPVLFGGYLDPALGRDRTIDDFHIIANHVSDAVVIVVRPDDNRFTSIEDFITLASNENLTFGTTGIGSHGHITFEVIREAMDLDMTMIPFAGGADVLAALMGGHIDVGTLTVGEVRVPMSNGYIAPLVVFADEQTQFLPGTPTWNETYPEVPFTVASRRSFAVRADTPAEIIAVFESALTYALNHPEGVARMHDMGLDIDFVLNPELTEQIKAAEALIRSLAPLMGWE